MFNLDDQPDNFLNADDIEAAGRGENPDSRTIDFAGDSGHGPSPRPPRRRGRRIIAMIVVVAFAALGVAAWMRYFNPFVTDARASGYVAGIERRGVIFKTFEGELIRGNVYDSIAPYQRDFTFSVVSDSLADRLQKYQLEHRRVTVGYIEYAATVPWRGSSRIVVTSVSPAPLR